MAEDGRSRLGRGLAALIGEARGEGVTAKDAVGDPAAAERARNQRRVPIEFLKPNPKNPRQNFSADELDELTASIRERGIIQPVIVRAVKGVKDNYEIVAGERRWRAAQRAGLHDVPVVVIEVTDSEALELAIIENVQRADLNAIEEAGGYLALADEHHRSHDGIAKIVGKSRSHITNTLRLLKLSEPIKAYIRSGKLSAGHARILVGQPNAEELAELIIDRGLNVRQIEALARQSGKEQAKEIKPKRKAGKSADTIALEKRLSDALGLQVSVDHRGKWGILQIHYRDLDQLEAVLHKLEGG